MVVRIHWMGARIYKPARTAMQSGTAMTKRWVLEFDPASARRLDPLMGWTSSDDMRSQVRLEFEIEGSSHTVRGEAQHSVHGFESESPPTGRSAARIRGELRAQPSGGVDALNSAFCAAGGMFTRASGLANFTGD